MGEPLGEEAAEGEGGVGAGRALKPLKSLGSVPNRRPKRGVINFINFDAGSSQKSHYVVRPFISGAPRGWSLPKQGNGKLSGNDCHATRINPKGSCREVKSIKKGC